jgi:dolichol-phosphate mannosyltransferase
MSKLTVVIPVRNEREAIPPLFARFETVAPQLPVGWNLLLVDGVSSDGTPDTAESWSDRLPVRVIRLSENRGLGGALEAGLLEAIAFSDVIVTMDGDDSHDPNTIPSMLAEIEDGADLVIASRFEPGGEEIGVAGHRKLLSHAASGLLRTLFPVGEAKDYSSGFRAYRTTALKSVEEAHGRLVEESGFSCMMELLLKLRSVGADVREVPLVLRYDLKPTESKMDIGHTVGRYVVVIGRNLPSAGRRPAQPRV